MGKKLIPDDIREEVTNIIDKFNKKELQGSGCTYVSKFRGKFLYLYRYVYGKEIPTCRLKYNGKLDDWEFAIFKWSSESYDPDEFFFPGIDLVDGTIGGAMKAGIEAYSSR